MVLKICFIFFMKSFFFWFWGEIETFAMFRDIHPYTVNQIKLTFNTVSFSSIHSGSVESTSSAIVGPFGQVRQGTVG